MCLTLLLPSVVEAEDELLVVDVGGRIIGGAGGVAQGTRLLVGRHGGGAIWGGVVWAVAARDTAELDGGHAV